MFLKQCEITQDTSRLTARTKVLTFDDDNEFLFVHKHFGSRAREIIRIMRRYGTGYWQF